tara:strand:- start:735 stop:1409 length:675 start_codon:yes stop_codon:yes gene_type:complete
MGIPEIPEIGIRDISIREIPINSYLDIEVPGCSYQHRDQNLQPKLLITDPNGVFYNCPGGAGIPSFYPMDWNPKDIKVIEEKPITKNEQPKFPETKQAKTEVPDEKKEETFKPCPGPNDQRVGDYRNEKKLERVSGHKRNLEGECETIYEPVAFIEQYLPTPATAVSTGAIALIAASSPLLLSVIKPAVKNIFKKLTTKKAKKENEKILSTSERRMRQRKKKQE